MISSAPTSAFVDSGSAMNPRIRTWKGTRVWVIGASTGIGAATVSLLLNKGALVALSARNASALQALAGNNSQALVLPLDITQHADVQKAHDYLLSAWGGIDIVLIVAGVYNEMRADSIDMAVVNQVLDINLRGTFNCIDVVLPTLLKQSYADERVIHYGLVPRSHRSIFVINELPDLQARIQVALFNILQEGDIQIRGFKIRMPLDILFVFTANPEDYTNRGSIVTPLKDRIGSQILTHYPKSVEISQAITKQEAQLSDDQRNCISVPPLVEKLLEQISFEARKSEYIDQKSGVSARLTISAYENLVSVVQRRMLLNNETTGVARINDLYGVIPSITGKVELVYEGELEGISNVAYTLISKTIRHEFINYFPDPERAKKSKQGNVYKEILEWFNEGNEIDLMHSSADKEHIKQLDKIKALQTIVNSFHKNSSKADSLLLREFILHGLAEFSQISKRRMESTILFSDLVGSIFNPGNE